MSFSQPPLYPSFSGNNYNPATFPSASSSGLSYQSALGLFVSYPQAQGKITLLETNITGNLRTSNNIFLDNSGNYIQFPDGTKQQLLQQMIQTQFMMMFQIIFQN